jgi:hypothetical protein
VSDNNKLTIPLRCIDMTISYEVVEVSHFLMFNRVARLTIDVSLRLPTATLIAYSILSRIPLAFELVENLKKAQSKMMARYSEIVSDFTFQVNDLVMYYNPIRRKGEPDKLQAKCKGPYRVVELSGEASALITLLEGQGNVEKVSVRRLRKITTPTYDTSVVWKRECI